MKSARPGLMVPLVFALVGAGFPLRLVAQRGAAQRSVALTFDDLPVASPNREIGHWRQVTSRLVGTLQANGAPAIGFVNEVKLYTGGTIDSARVALLVDWVHGGLDLGNHSFSHHDLNSAPLAAFEADVLRGEQVTRQVLKSAGREPRFFRHPLLHTGNSRAKRREFETFLGRHRYRIAPVTVDNDDFIFAYGYELAVARGQAARAQEIGRAYIEYMDSIFAFHEREARKLLGYEPPQVLLLHASLLNADHLAELLTVLRRRGYRFVTIEEALRDPAYARPDRYDGPIGLSWLFRWTTAPVTNPSTRDDYPAIPAEVLSEWRARQ